MQATVVSGLDKIPRNNLKVESDSRLLGHLPALLEVVEISKSFKGLKALRDLSFSLDQGEVLGLIGPNGAGKTTAFNIIAGVQECDSGVVRLAGKKISGKRPHVISKLGVARTFQIAKPFTRMTTLENAMVGALFGRAGLLSLQRAQASALESLDFVGLAPRASVLASELTLAEQRRLVLARALASNPRLLMLDEIMAGLNDAEVGQTITLLQRMNRERGLSLLVIEHVMMAINRLCHRIVVMNQGEKLAEGTPEEILHNMNVVEAYMGRGLTQSKRHNSGGGAASSFGPSGGGLGP
jgi:branched-chain amino acid transport system ATP-binding protein